MLPRVCHKKNLPTNSFAIFVLEMERCHHISFFFSDLRCFLPLPPSSSSSFRRAPRASNLRSRERGKRKKRRRSVSESAAGASVLLSARQFSPGGNLAKCRRRRRPPIAKKERKKFLVCEISPLPPSTTFSLTFSVFEGERKGWEWGKKKEKDYLIPRCLRLPPFRSLLGWRKQKKWNTSRFLSGSTQDRKSPIWVLQKGTKKPEK